jgi:transposase
MADAQLLAQHALDRLVFVDESGVDERDGRRRFGYAVRGRRATLKFRAGRGQRQSLVGALGLDGMIAVRSVTGTTNAAEFLDFILTCLLPRCTPWPGPRSVLVLDNASIHKAPELRTVLLRAGVFILFLPAYTPQLNPLELVWNQVKSRLKRFGDLPLRQRLWQPLLPSVAADQLANFRSCGWGAVE